MFYNLGAIETGS